MKKFIAGQSVFPEDFRREAARALRDRGRRTADEVAKELGVSTASLYFWDKQLGSEPRYRSESKYSEEFRRKTGLAFRDRGSVSADAFARKVGIARSLLYRWAAIYGGDISEGSSALSRAEPPNERTGYVPQSKPAKAAKPVQERQGEPETPRESRAETAELSQLRAQRERLAQEAAALRRTIVLLSRDG